jgi:putative oxidoreductase
MMKDLQAPGLLIGRILLAWIFIGSGFGKIMGFAGTAAHMAAAGLPMARILLVPTIAIELGGGLLLAVGYKTRCAAIAIFLFLIPTTLVFHAFWSAAPEQAMMQAINFQKNLAIMGGMLYVMFCGPGRLSVDGA